MGQALYRKYRSTSLSEIIGQEHITTALQQAIATDRLSHAYLFTGPRGVGKTSIARIMAHAMNGLDYSKDANLDIIEIDAASNRRIDEIRDLRDKVYIAPTSARYKVYIIDEVHMLTREAFNALLKTLEEPPAHVIFILATTDAHKLPETIVSRTQRYNFRPVEKQKVVDHLAFIAKAEDIDIDTPALELLAEHGEGSFRDSISMLDQVSNQAGAVTLDTVRSQLGIPPEEGVRDVLSSLTDATVNQPVIALQRLYDQGYRAVAIAAQLGTIIRGELTSDATTLPARASLELLKQLLEVPAAHDPERLLELTLMDVIIPTAVVVAPATPKATLVAEVAPKAKPIADAKPTPAAIEEPIVVVESIPEPTAQDEVIAEISPTVPANGQTALDEAIWPQVLAELKKQYNTIYGIVRMAHPDFSQPGKLSLAFAFAFHQKRISDPKNRKIVADTIEHVTGQQVEISCSVSKDLPIKKAGVATPTVSAAPPDAALQDISSIFGGGELI